MASSEGLTTVEPSWSLRQSFNVDSWLIPDLFSNDSSDLLTKALHKSISTTTDHPPPLSPSAFFDSSAAISDLSTPRSLSNVSFGSDPEFAGGVSGAKRKRGGSGGPGGKPAAKRRSRVSTKKSQTTFITADAANFRQMVQQVTGAKFIGGGGGSHNIFSSPVVKPEPHRLVNKLPPYGGGVDRSSTVVPTLDTSSFLSNHHQENLVTGLGSASAGSFHQSSVAPVMKTPADIGGGGGGSAVDFDTYPSFPTLESWKVM